MKTIKLQEASPDILNKNVDNQIILENLYKSFCSEENTNNLEEAIEKLEQYVYIPSTVKLWSGRYILLIDIRKPFDMKVVNAGFLNYDNGYTINVINNDKIRNYSKRNFITFMLPSEKDLFLKKLRSI